LALFGGALVAAVSLYTIYNEWVRSKNKKPPKDAETSVEDDTSLETTLAELDAAQRAEDEARRRLLDEQDMEYIISEQLDAEKDRKKAAEEAEKRNQEAIKESLKTADLEARRKKLSALPEPPVGQGSHILDLTVMIPELENSTTHSLLRLCLPISLSSVGPKKP